MDTLLSSYNAGKFIHIKGKLPVELKKKTGQPEGPIPYGEYRLIFRKCEDEDAAEAHFYRDQISIPGFNNRKPLVQESRRCWWLAAVPTTHWLKCLGNQKDLHTSLGRQVLPD